METQNQKTSKKQGCPCRACYIEVSEVPHVSPNNIRIGCKTHQNYLPQTFASVVEAIHAWNAYLDTLTREEEN